MAVEYAEPARLWITGLQALALRALAGDPFLARQIEAEKGINLFLDSDPADVKEDRPLFRCLAVARWIEQFEIHPARPQASAGNASRLEVGDDRRRRRERGARRIVEAPQERVGPRCRNAKTRFDILGKAAVIGGGERPAAAHGDAAGRPAERAFGGDVQAIGGKGVDMSLDIARRRQRQADFRIGRTGDGAKFQRREQPDLMPLAFKFAPRHLERAHHAIDLRFPGVADDQYFHLDFPIRAIACLCPRAIKKDVIPAEAGIRSVPQNPGFRLPPK